jgi:beta-lactamase regulating signal transducer with metallopeptidase domain
MTIDLLIELAWKSASVAGLTLLALALLRRRSAGERALVGHVGVLALALLPAAIVALPTLRFTAPDGVAEMLAPTISSQVPDAAGATGSASRREGQVLAQFDWSEALLAAYLSICAAFLAGLIISVLRLQRVRARAALVQDPHWLTALAAAQHRAGFKHGTALLSSGELKSPISWGLMRPIIIVDHAALAQKDRAEAIITHELAHVTRMDWLRLLTGRFALALFWFNPLVWVLVRTAHHLSEEAADDAVLRTDVPDCDYAELLVGAVRHAHRPAFLPANGVAPSRSSLGKRISHVLDTTRPRQPARLGWAVASLAVAASLNGVIAAAEPLAAQALPTQGAPTADAAAEQLERIGDPHTTALAAALRSRDWSRRAPQGRTTFNQPAAVAPLRSALRDPDPVARRIAVWGLSEMRPTPGAESAQPVAELLDDSDPAVRGQAARALGDFQSDSYAQQLTQLLRDPTPGVRLQAAHALGDLQNPNSRAALQAARSDPDAAVRSKVAWALKQIAEAESILRRYGGD